jgi:hypothetical protein
MIDRFFDDYRFLSNFYPSKVVFEEVEYPTVEHAYAAAKTLDLALRKEISNVKTAGEVKRLGRKLALREDWEYIKLRIMLTLVLYKFRNNPDLKEMLLNTKDEYLVEGNSWGDKYWGVSNGVGENKLGKILMAVRAILRQKEL